MPAQTTATPYTVSIVEDEAILRQEMAFQLQCLGFAVEQFASAETFYRYLATRPKTVVVLDIGLAGEDGLSVCQYLRAHDPQIGIVFVTARGLRSDRLTGLEIGADAYLVKPVDLEELTLILRRLGQRLLAAQPPEAPSALDSGGWLLQEGPTFLLTPNRTRVRLSNNEYRLLKALLRQPGAPCPHAELAIALNLQPDEYHKHRVEVIFSRLRDRVLRLSGEALPLQAERSFGYRFLPG